MNTHSNNKGFCCPEIKNYYLGTDETDTTEKQKRNCAPAREF
jgi:hypothetical protein